MSLLNTRLGSTASDSFLQAIAEHRSRLTPESPDTPVEESVILDSVGTLLNDLAQSIITEFEDNAEINLAPALTNMFTGSVPVAGDGGAAILTTMATNAADMGSSNIT